MWHRLLDRIITGALVGDLDEKTALIVRPDGETVAELPVASLVAAVAPTPAVELVAVAESLAIPYALAGDAMAPRTAYEAFREGHAVGVSI